MRVFLHRFWLAGLCMILLSGCPEVSRIVGAIGSDMAMSDFGLVDQRLTDLVAADSFLMPPDTATSVPGTWVTIPAGKYIMGSPQDEHCRDLDETQHQVTLTHKFEMMTTEVTQAQFSTVLGYSPSYFSWCGDACPVEMVSWSEAAAYANALSTRAGLAACYTCTGSGASVSCGEATAYAGGSIYTCPGYRLPTEAEWEYTYRAGTSTALYNGDITSCFQDTNMAKIGWYSYNASSTSHLVGQKEPNAWGLYDMAGNMFEWCEDFYGTYPSTNVTDPVGKSGLGRVIRGGSWEHIAEHARAADRDYVILGYREDYLGFRVARSVP